MLLIKNKLYLLFFLAAKLQKVTRMALVVVVEVDMAEEVVVADMVATVATIADLAEADIKVEIVVVILEEAEVTPATMITEEVVVGVEAVAVAEETDVTGVDLCEATGACAPDPTKRIRLDNTYSFIFTY